MTRLPQAILRLTLILTLISSCSAPPPSNRDQSADQADRLLATSTTTPAQLPTTNSLVAQPGVYLINQRARSQSLAAFEAIVYRVELTKDALIVRFGMQNITTERRYFNSAQGFKDLRLLDSAGNEYRPSVASANLERFNLRDGFLPSQANVGEVTFPIPTADGPFTLHIPAFEPLSFTLDQLAPATDLVVPDGTYPIDISLHSSHATFVPLSLRIERVTVTRDEVTFAITFTNNGRRPIGVSGDLNGYASRLLDAEGTIYRPIWVSDQLRDKITPTGDLFPGQSHGGEIVFPRPQPIEQLRFFFPRYTMATLTFSEHGLISTIGSAPPSTTIPPLAEQARRTLAELLSQQARAMIAGDLTSYLNTFATTLQPAQERIFRRSQQLPLADYRLALTPDTRLNEAEWERGEQAQVKINVSYRWHGLPADNIFQHTLTAWFSQQDGRWVVNKYEADPPAPFWWLADVQVAESKHCLILYQSAAADLVKTITTECEQSYAELEAAGLSLDAQLAIYVMANQRDFNEQTGQGARTLGLARWNYVVQADTIQTKGRAIYLNGAALAERTGADLAVIEATITYEMARLALARETTPFTPVWLAEGAAMIFSGRYRPELRQSLVSEGEGKLVDLAALTAVDQFGPFDATGDQVEPEYLIAAEVVQYLIDTYGSERFWQFYRSFTRVPAERLLRNPASFRNEVVSEMLNTVYGLSLAELEADVEAALQQ